MPEGELKTELQLLDKQTGRPVDIESLFPDREDLIKRVSGYWASVSGQDWEDCARLLKMMPTVKIVETGKVQSRNKKPIDSIAGLEKFGDIQISYK